MKRFFELLQEREYSTAVIYGFFTLISLVVALVLFGILESTGAINIQIGNIVNAGSFTGAFAGFFVTLVFLTVTYNRYQQRETFSISGTVYDLQGRPAQDVRVVVEGINSSDRTDHQGYFEIDARELRGRGLAEYTITGSDTGSIGKITINKRDVRRPVSIELKPTDPKQDGQQ